MKRLLLLFAVAILASCSNDAKDVSTTVTTPYDGSVGFTAAITPSTRIDAFDSADQILVAAYEDGGAYGDQVVYTHNGTNFTSTAGIVREDADQLLSYIAVYPATVTGFGTSFNFTVETDQRATINTSDLLVATLAETTSTTPQLNFTHALTSLAVEFEGDNLDGGTLVVNAVPGTDVVVSGTTYTAAADGTAAIELTAASDGYNYFEVIFAPQAIAAGTAFATYTVGDNEPYTWTTNNDLEFESGCRYAYKWSIDTAVAPSDPDYDGTVTLTGTINDWEDQDMTDEPVEPVVYAVGDYYPNEEEAVGIVFLVDETGTSGKVISLYTEEENLNYDNDTESDGYNRDSWLTFSSLELKNNGTSTTDGLANMETALATTNGDITQYPIYEWVHDNLNGGGSDMSIYESGATGVWYIPATQELREWFAYLFGGTADNWTSSAISADKIGVESLASGYNSATAAEKLAFNDLIAAVNGQEILFSSNILSSTETATATQECLVIYAAAGTNSYQKDYSSSLVKVAIQFRPIMAF